MDLRDAHVPAEGGKPHRGGEALRRGVRAPKEVLAAHRLLVHRGRPLNEIIHLWRSQDLAERSRIRADVAKDPNWPPKIQSSSFNMQSEIIVPFRSTTDLLPGKIGPIFEVQ